MRNMLFAPLLVGLFAFGQGPTLMNGAHDKDKPVNAVRGGTVLYTTFGGEVADPFKVSSQEFTGPFAPYQSMAADDFTIGGNGATVTEIEVKGSFFNGPPSGPITAMNVYIMTDNAGMPNTDTPATNAFYRDTVSVADLDVGDYIIPINNGMGIDLDPGTYWVALQAQMDFNVGRQWGWAESADGANTGNIHGNESVWMQTSATLGANCIGAFGLRVTDCDQTSTATPPAEHDLSFEVRGNPLTPSIIVTNLSGDDLTSMNTVEGGSAVTYNVRLGAIPTGGASVQVDLTLTQATSEVGLSTTSLTFDDTDWDSDQTVTVTPVAPADGNDGSIPYTIEHTTGAGVGGGFASITGPTINGTNDNVEGTEVVLVDPASGLSVDEDSATNGNTATFDIFAGTDVSPTADVRVTLTPDANVTVSPNPVDLTAGNGYRVTVTVNGVTDDMVDGPIPFSIVTSDTTSGDVAYNGIVVADVSGTVNDNDTASVIVREAGGAALGSQSTDETGGTDTFEIVLSSMPSDTVTIPLTVGDPDEGTISTPSVVFDPADWSTPVVVTITGADDDVDDGDVTYSVVTEPVTSNDTNYAGINPDDVTVVNADDTDQAGFTVAPTSGLETNEQGGEATFTVTLDSTPVGGVILPLSTDDISEGLVSINGTDFFDSVDLTFAAGEKGPKTVTVQGVNDFVEADGDIVYNIVTGDPTAFEQVYDDITAAQVPDVEVTNIDMDDVVGVTVSTASITTNEDPTDGAHTVQFTVVLTSEPTDTVTISAASDDESEAVVSPASVDFNSGNWNVARTFTVQSQRDFEVDGDINYNIVIDSSSGDANYNAFDPADIAGLNLDEDVCGPVTISTTLGGPITLIGTPGCFVDFYDTNGSANPSDWDLLAANLEIGVDGTVVIPGIVSEADAHYLVTIAGSTVALAAPFATVPTLGEWGLMIFVTMLGFAAIAFMRRRRLA